MVVLSVLDYVFQRGHCHASGLWEFSGGYSSPAGVVPSRGHWGPEYWRRRGGQSTVGCIPWQQGECTHPQTFALSRPPFTMYIQTYICTYIGGICSVYMLYLPHTYVQYTHAYVCEYIHTCVYVQSIHTIQTYIL